MYLEFNKSDKHKAPDRSIDYVWLPLELGAATSSKKASCPLLVHRVVRGLNNAKCLSIGFFFK